MKLSIVPQDFDSNKDLNKGTKLKLQNSEEPKITKLKLNPKPQYQGPTAADTILYTPRTHVYKRPEMWMGANADIFIEEETWLYDTEALKIYKKMINNRPKLTSGTYLLGSSGCISTGIGNPPEFLILIRLLFIVISSSPTLPPFLRDILPLSAPLAAISI